MKIVSITYERKFGGAKGSSVEEYGSELVHLEATAEEGEDISLEDAFKKTLGLKQVAYQVHSPKEVKKN